jgi:hypothetical protein
MSQNKISRQEALSELWRRGILTYKLDSAQKKLYEKFYSSQHKVQTWLLSRRSGKTYLLCVLALEQCIKHPKSIVKFASPTKLQVNNNVRPLFDKLLDDCPPEIKPKLSTKDYIYYFPNGSEIQLAGTDGGHAEKLRGGDSHLWFVDEAGSCDDLDNIVKSVLLPTTLITKGKGILASTPPREADHEFIKFIEQAELRGSLTKLTIDDNPRLTNEQKEELFLELGGNHTEEARRELYCELIRDPSTSVIPEFTTTLEAEIVKEWPKPPFYDCYEAMDVGFNDLTAILFAYYDFRADKVIIEDEFTVNGSNLQLNKLVGQIKDKEKGIWYDPLSQTTKTPYLRVSDINPIVQSEIRLHSNNEINFISTKKDDKDSAINTLRMMLAAKKIIIHPRCVNLIRHLKNVKWMSKNNKTKFARSQDDGHYDLVDAAVYLIRNIIYGKNPYPAHYGVSLRDAFGNPVMKKSEYSNDNSQLDMYRRIFNVKPRR